MLHFFLAVVFFAVADQRPPFVMAHFTDAAECHKAAARVNAMEPRMKAPDFQAMGAEAVCLKVDRPQL
jgi:hypothetical protein